jgi:type II restriction enzyme
MARNNQIITGNKGEWSEIYALFKLLGDRNLFAGDADLNKIETLFYPIIKILRSETEGNYEYTIIGDIVLISGGSEQLRIPIKTFAEQAKKLLEKIKKSNGAFSIPDIQEFMESVKCNTIKTKSSSKSDISIIIHDTQISQAAELGFSIKSKLGGDSTLLNAGKSTNFIFRIQNFKGNEENIDVINNIQTRSKIKDRIEEIKKLGGKLEFDSLENSIFKNNLVLIDSLLPNILAQLVKLFYTSNKNTIVDLVEEITKNNPLNYDNQFSHLFYEYKVKRFLTDVALGMMPAKVWDGHYDATGGYLIVKEDGEVLCYHIYNRNQFEDYLFQNTKLETASSTRHDFGRLYSLNDILNFKLNLQIRFI